MTGKSRIETSLALVIFLSLSFFIPQSRAFSSDSLRIDTDYAVYKYIPDLNKSYLEIYYSLEQKELEYLKQEKGYAAVVSLELVLKGQNGEKVKEKSWQIGNLVPDPEKVKTSDAQLIDVLGDTLAPGIYSLELRALDLNSNKTGTVKTQLLIPGFKGDSLQMSDLQFALSLKEDTTEVKFNKAGMKVMPNPRKEYVSKELMLYLYAEIYNLKFDSAGKEKGYSLDFSVLDSTGSNPKDYGSMIHTKPGNTSIVVSALNIGSLLPGKYILQVSAKDLASGEEVSKVKPFQVSSSSSYEDTDLPRTEAEAKNLRRMLTYIATRDELKMYDQLNLSGKRQFMAEFWRKKDPNPSTPENEFKIEYYRRWQEALNKYSTSQKEKDGWKTDMGRVYILYGEPNDIERHPQSMSSKSWERWNYDHIQGGVYFIFVDVQGYGVYKLIHSSAKGEIKDPEWQQRYDTESATETRDY